MASPSRPLWVPPRVSQGSTLYWALAHIQAQRLKVAPWSLFLSAVSARPPLVPAGEAVLGWWVVGDAWRVACPALRCALLLHCLFSLKAAPIRRPCLTCGPATACLLPKDSPPPAFVPCVLCVCVHVPLMSTHAVCASCPSGTTHTPRRLLE